MENNRYVNNNLFMMYTFFFVLAILPFVFADRHAIIIAPRSNWADYGVQSESCRMYKDLVSGGMDPKNIILMSTTKVSNDPTNPIPGNLYTDDSPSTPGKDYAHGCTEFIDYDENDMTGEIMLAILQGDVNTLKKLTGKENPKALHSTSEDNVMLYFTSHGGHNSIVVGKTAVTERDLYYALKNMNEKKMYKNFLILMEACFSGSMLENLPTYWNVYAISAADNKNPSYESHCPPNDIVDGKEMNTCLSCLWDNAIEWFMEGGESHTLDEVFQHGHDKVAETSRQNVSKWGSVKTMGSMLLSDFVGDIPAKRFSTKTEATTSIAKSDVPHHLAMWKAIRADKSTLASALADYENIVIAEAKREIEVMRLGRSLMNEKDADKAMKNSAEIYSISCVRSLEESLIRECGHEYPLAISTIHMLENICLPGLSVPNVDFKDICI